MSPSSLEYDVIDVFTDEKFAGNPLAVVRLTADDDLNQDQKHKITSEFNLSETVFLNPAKDGKRQIDIFTPGSELAFAGHPTIGTAILLGEEHPDATELTLLTKAGPIPITFERQGTSLQASVEIPHKVHVHGAKLSQKEAVKLQPELGQGSKRYAPWPVVSIVNGMTFVLIRLESINELDTLEPFTSLTSKDFVKLDEGWDDNLVGLYFYVMHPPYDTETQFISCRMLLGLLEDPATGSAASTLGSYLALQRQEGQTDLQDTTFSIEQGAKMGRRSSIGVSVKAGRGKVHNVKLSGGAVRVASGKIYV